MKYSDGALVFRGVYCQVLFDEVRSLTHTLCSATLCVCRSQKSKTSTHTHIHVHTTKAVGCCRRSDPAGAT